MSAPVAVDVDTGVIHEPTRPGTLYEIGEDLVAFTDALLAAEDEEAERILAKWGEELQRDEAAKVDRMCSYIRELQVKSEGQGQEAKRLQELSASNLRAAERIKSLILEHFGRFGRRSMETPRFRISRCQNGGKTPIEFDPQAEPEDAPKKFHFYPPARWDTDAVREALEDGEGLPFARFGERGFHLRIR